MSRKALPLLDSALVGPAVIESFRKLDPRVQFRNPVMFIVFVGSILTTGLWIQALGGHGEAPAGFIGAVTVWLWFTVLFANFAEALAEGRSKAQAASLRSTKGATQARKLREPKYGAAWTLVDGESLRRGDVVVVQAHEVIPCDGEVIEGAATVDESAITGALSPVIADSSTEATPSTMSPSDGIMSPASTSTRSSRASS